MAAKIPNQVHRKNELPVWRVSGRKVTFRASVVGAAPTDQDWAILLALVES